MNGSPQLEMAAERGLGECYDAGTGAGELRAGDIVIGRVLLSRLESSPSSLSHFPSPQSFAYTKYALRLLEKVGACVVMNEPTLLVGETGSGKTTSVQELANLTGRRLVVQNLSLSTDTSDLLGTYVCAVPLDTNI